MRPDLRSVAAMAIVAAVSSACARAEERPPVTLTSAEMATGYAEAAAASESTRNYNSALRLADHAVALAPENAWGHYNRAVALHHLGETDRALEAYRDAETRFRGSPSGRSLAIYGRARALDDAGRCDEARAAYGEFAAVVQSTDPRAADMARSYAQQCRTTKTQPAEDVASDVSVAVVARDYERALSLADRAEKETAQPSPWVEYNRAVALAQLNKTDEAVQAFRSAEQAFAARASADPESRWGQSVAIYGRARALDTGGRCQDAIKAYKEYAGFVQDRQAADQALAVAQRCGTKP